MATPKKYVGWKRPATGRWARFNQWEKVCEAEDFADCHQMLMQEELKASEDRYQYAVLPEGQDPNERE
jgi:hypothetical protein